MQTKELVNLKEKKVALLGFGVENKAFLSYAQAQGAEATVLDQNEELADQLQGVKTELGPDYLKDLSRFDVIVRSPGVSILLPELQAAQQAGVLVTTQIQYVLERCPAKVIGVTGTKGKGTTSSLVAHILKQAKATREIEGEIYLAGNIGQPPISFLDQLTDQDWLVLELSSFQLQDLKVSPHIAVVLNVTSDHLDYHRDEAEYISAKKNIVRYQTPNDYLVVHADSPTSQSFVHETPAQVYYFSRHQSVEQGTVIDYSADEPMIVWCSSGGLQQPVAPVSKVRLVGPAHLENVCAAVTVARILNIHSQTIADGLTDFTGLPHRLQLVAHHNEVAYYDDSQATTPDSVIAALEAFTEPVVLILGGSSKGADYTELIEMLPTRKIRQVLCIGQEGERLYESLKAAGLPVANLGRELTMDQVVMQAAAAAQPGDVVLLSPGAASFDMFNNAGDRGDQFQEAVRSLADNT